MTYAWTITVDNLNKEDEGTTGVGVVGPGEAELTHDEVKVHPDRQAFMIFDDDGIHYYSGFMVHGGDSDGFEPLDDYGTPNDGATEIRYREGKNGPYKTL